MSELIENLLQRAREILPEVAIEGYELNQEGLFNDVLMVNGEYVFRFAKTENGARLLAEEARLLELIRPAVEVEVAAPVHLSHGCMVYPMLKGQALTRKLLRSLEAGGQERTAAQLGAFLYRLHGLETTGRETAATGAPVTRESWLRIRRRAEEKIAPLLLPYQAEWMADLFEAALEDEGFFAYRPALIHADLAPYHLLYNERQQRLCGVLDFGVAGMGDPAVDFGLLIHLYGETFVEKMHPVYPGLEEHLRRARFYAQGLEIQWALNGLEGGEPFWFTAHLGAAKDMRG